ncbi:MAG: hypothetical protein WKF37_09275 [Bryobacteraceae bacterium]
MSGPVVPPPFEALGHRPFSFYPSILNIEHNEWRYRKATWSEILVVNTKSGEEVWVPRRFVGQISRVDEPVMILGLTKELEYSSGQLLPHARRVIEMPRAVNDSFTRSVEESPAAPAPVVGIRLENGAESRVGRLILSMLAVAVFATVIVVSFFKGGSRVTYAPVLQSELGFSALDDYHAIVRKLGQPEKDQWRSEAGEMQFRALRYPQQNLAVILMGSERDKARYVGSLDNNWRPVHAITLPDGRSTASVLRSLKRF